MIGMMQERRMRRSGDAPLALHYQLEHSREHGGLEALVLADDNGLVVAGSGDRAACAELAAIAPLRGRAPFGMPLPAVLRGGDVAIRPLTIGGERLYLASLGGSMARDALLAHSMEGVQRILAVN